MKERKRRLAVALLVALAVTASAAYGGIRDYLAPDQPVLQETTTQDVAPGDSKRAIDALAALAIKGRAPKTDYSRSQFGSGWDTVGNCDVRNHILARDLIDVQFVSPTDCTVQSGTLAQDPYTGTSIAFVRGPGSSSKIQIDHVVALSDAWQKGAQQLDKPTRQKFANDPLNLLAVDGPTNTAKGDGDAATWLPPHKPYRCRYVARQIAVKQKYQLWVTQAERDAMARVLGDCTEQLLPGGEIL